MRQAHYEHPARHSHSAEKPLELAEVAWWEMAMDRTSRRWQSTNTTEPVPHPTGAPSAHGESQRPHDRDGDFAAKLRTQLIAVTPLAG
jgi:hypothetical protein